MRLYLCRRFVCLWIQPSILKEQRPVLWFELLKWVSIYVFSSKVLSSTIAYGMKRDILQSFAFEPSAACGDASFISLTMMEGRFSIPSIPLPPSNSHFLGWEPRNFLCLVETDGLAISQVYAFFSPWLLSEIETKAFSSLMQTVKCWFDLWINALAVLRWLALWGLILLTCVALCLLYDAKQCLLNVLTNENQVFGVIWTQFLNQKFLNNGLEAKGTERLGNRPPTVRTTSSMLKKLTHIMSKIKLRLSKLSGCYASEHPHLRPKGPHLLWLYR